MPADRPTPLSWLWYLAALNVTLIGLIIGVIVAAGAWDAVRAAPVTSLSRPLDAEGSSVAVFTDSLQADLKIACSSRTRGAWQPMSPAPIALPVDDDGVSWQLVAFESHGEDSMQIRCHPTRGRTDHAQYGVSVVDGFNRRSELGTWIRTASVGLGAVFAIVVFVRRRRATLTP